MFEATTEPAVEPQQNRQFMLNCHPKITSTNILGVYFTNAIMSGLINFVFFVLVFFLVDEKGNFHFSHVHALKEAATMIFWSTCFSMVT